MDILQKRRQPPLWPVDAAAPGPVSSELAEGPVWDAAHNSLVWVDILAGEVHTIQVLPNSHRVISLGTIIGALALAADDRMILATSDGFLWMDPNTCETGVVAEIEADNPANRMNDGKCDRLGRFWAGTMAFDETPAAGSLYRLNVDGSVTTMLTGVTISNGIDWSPDDRLMYYVDSATRRIDVFDFDLVSGEMDNRRAFVSVPAGVGIPDGLTVDERGHVWVALWDGAAVHEYDADGKLIRAVGIPAPHATSCTFGDWDRRTLYITAAGETNERRAPCLFRCRPGARGKLPYRCALSVTG